jgi:uncharacterized membrane protein
MSQMNPYEPETPAVRPAGVGIPAADFLPEARAVAAGRGMDWITAGWRLFKAQPGMWILLVIVYFIFVIVVALVPVLGAVINMLIYPVIAAGMLLAARAVEEGKPLEIAYLFAGFKHNTGNLVMVGLLTLIGWIAIAIPIFMILGGSAIFAMVANPNAAAASIGSSALLAALVAVGLSVPLYMALWFAPALVIFHNLAPVPAMKTSFFACLKNVVPFLIYGIVLLVLGIIATIPAGLGWLILVPVIIASIYMGYRDIFYRA